LYTVDSLSSLIITIGGSISGMHNPRHDPAHDHVISGPQTRLKKLETSPE